MSFDMDFIGLDQKHTRLAWKASPFLSCFCSYLINLISEDTNMVFCMSPLYIREDKIAPEVSWLF